MDSFTVVRGPAAPLMLANVNTDVISPGHTGKGDMALSAFAPIRYLPDGRDDPSFVLNREPFRGRRSSLPRRTSVAAVHVRAPSGRCGPLGSDV